MKKTNLPVFTVILLSSLIWSCQSDNNFNSDINNLAFETDSIIFDTVFTDVGSATEVFLIYNTSNENLLIEEIKLAGGENSAYKINFDGIANHQFKDIEILPGDSLYTFVEVFIDPNNIATPFVVKDSIVFSLNNKETDVKLVSWGQNAYFHFGDTITQNETWKADKPHVIYGEVIVGGGATLTIDECTEVYGHNLSRLNIARNSALVVNGSVDCPVIFKGDRKEARYEDEPGQWIGIRLLPGAAPSRISHAIIKNGFRGVEVDSMMPSREPNLLLENTTISTMNLVCLLGYTASIQAINCEFINSCEYLTVGELGGNYNFTYCTFGNYQKSCVRTTPSVYLSNANYVDIDENEFSNPLDFNFLNCIIYGSQEEELGFNQSGSGTITASIAHTLIRTKLLEFDINNNIINSNPLFINPNELNYQLDTLSPAIEKALPIGNLNTDYFLRLRDLGNPDLGAFERVD